MHGADSSQSRVGARSNPYMLNQSMTTKVTGSNKAAQELNRVNYPKLEVSDKNIIEGHQRIN